VEHAAQRVGNVADTIAGRFLALALEQNIGYRHQRGCQACGEDCLRRITRQLGIAPLCKPGRELGTLGLGELDEFFEFFVVNFFGSTHGLNPAM
jgi:hypothetical protein